MAGEAPAFEGTEGATTGDSGTGAAVAESATGLTAPAAWSDDEMGGGQTSTKAQESSKGLTDTGLPGSEEGKKAEGEEDDPAKATAGAAAKEGSGDDGDEEQGGDKPPKGYAPVEALKQQKSAVKYFKSELLTAKTTIADLEKQLAERPTAAKPDELKDFQVLSDDEIEELADDDPVAAAKYVKDLRRFEKAQETSAKEKKAREAREEADAIETFDANERISKVLVVDGQNIQADLAKFAAENGFTEELFILTDPATQIIVNGEEGPRALTSKAASMVEFLAKMMHSQKATTGKAITIDNVPADVRAAIIAQEQEKIIGKVRQGVKPRSITEISSSSQDDGTGKFKGKAYADLSPEERQEYMQGN